jgi:flagellar biosynthesis protein FlhB
VLVAAQQMRMVRHILTEESKKMNTKQARNADLPIRCNLTLIYALSLIVAILMVTASIAGLLFRTVIYQTDELLRSYPMTWLTSSLDYQSCLAQCGWRGAAS